MTNASVINSLSTAQDGAQTTRGDEDDTARGSAVPFVDDLAGMRRLYEMHARLANELDLESALREVCATAADLAGTDRAAVQLVGDDGVGLEIHAQCGYEDDDPFVLRLEREKGNPIGHTARTIVEDVATSSFPTGTRTRDDWLKSNVRAFCSIPMTMRDGETAGLLSVQFASPGRPDDATLDRLDLLAWTAAEFVARLRADQSQREAQAGNALMAEIGDDLAASTDLAKDLPRVAYKIGMRLGADLVAFGDVDADRGTMSVVHAWHASRMPDCRGVHRIDELFDAAYATRAAAGRMFVSADVSDDPDAKADAFARLGVRALVHLPSARDGRWQATLMVGDRTRRLWRAHEVTLLRELAGRIRARVERLRADEALRASEERLRRFGDASRDALWIRDANTLQWTYLTPAAESVYGVARDVALRGDSFAGWAALIEPDDREHAVASVLRAARGETVTFDYRVRRAFDGALRWLRDTDFPIVDASGTVTAVGGIASDVTEEREWQAALVAIEGRQRALIEGIVHLVWRAVGEGAWTWGGPQWTAYTGQTDEESRGWGWLEAIAPEDRATMRGVWHEAQSLQWLSAECRIRNAAEGRDRWFQVRARPVRDADGRVMEWLGTCTDIDDQVRARELLDRAREALEARVEERTVELRQALDELHAESNERLAAESRLRHGENLKAVGQLAAGIAHDFNNVLQGVTSGLELVQRCVRHDRLDDALGYLDRADGGVRRAAALARRLLAFRREQSLSPEPVGVDRIASGIVGMVRQSVGPAVQVELRLGDGHWLVLCDVGQFDSAVVNLCINARDAMPDGGRLTISTGEVVLSAADLAGHEGLPPGRYATLAVSDTGTGITPDVRARMFEPFYSTKAPGAGTGLGLPQVEGFVRQANGFVDVRSAPGVGTTVRLHLPFHEADPEAPVTSDDDAAATILFVDDERDIREMTAELLRELGYRVLEAEDGAAALRLVDSGAAIDLVVTDVGMPGLDGRELASAIRKARPGMPVVFVTGYAGDAPFPDGPVVNKPFDVTRLAEVVANALAEAAPGVPAAVDPLSSH